MVIGEMLNILERFHHQSSRRIAGMTEKCMADRMWEYTPVVAALEAVVLYPVQEYIFEITGNHRSTCAMPPHL